MKRVSPDITRHLLPYNRTLLCIMRYIAHNDILLSLITGLRKLWLPGGVMILIVRHIDILFIPVAYPKDPAYGFSEFCTLCGISAALSGQENACIALNVLAFIEIKVNNYMGALPPES